MSLNCSIAKPLCCRSVMRINRCYSASARSERAVMITDGVLMQCYSSAPKMSIISASSRGFRFRENGTGTLPGGNNHFVFYHLHGHSSGGFDQWILRRNHGFV